LINQIIHTSGTCDKGFP